MEQEPSRHGAEVARWGEHLAERVSLDELHGEVAERGVGIVGIQHQLDEVHRVPTILGQRRKQARLAHPGVGLDDHVARGVVGHEVVDGLDDHRSRGPALGSQARVDRRRIDQVAVRAHAPGVEHDRVVVTGDDDAADDGAGDVHAPAGVGRGGRYPRRRWSGVVLHGSSGAGIAGANPRQRRSKADHATSDARERIGDAAPGALDARGPRAATRRPTAERPPPVVDDVVAAVEHVLLGHLAARHVEVVGPKRVESPIGREEPEACAQPGVDVEDVKDAVLPFAHIRADRSRVADPPSDAGHELRKCRVGSGDRYRSRPTRSVADELDRGVRKGHGAPLVDVQRARASPDRR